MGKRVLVLGGSGMLGAMMVGVLQDQGMEVAATFRHKQVTSLGWYWFDAQAFILNTIDIPEYLMQADWIINCIGITKPEIDKDPNKGRKSAIEINALFPILLARSLSSHQRLIQIATDCVFSGKKGGYAERGYTEGSPHDALDIYGKTKSLGEVNLPNVMHLRCSIIGPEFREEKKFLLEWLVRQPKGATVPGYIAHTWNGLTTWHFAKICRAIICDEKLFSPDMQHLLAGHHYVNKMKLLSILADAFDRNDLDILPKDTPPVYRHLSTERRDAHYNLWCAAGYEIIPTIEEMITELANELRHGDFSPYVLPKLESAGPRGQ